MDEIEVVIRIPEEWIEQFKAFEHPSALHVCVLQGTVLPKGHGRLGDIGEIEDEYCRHISLHMSDGEMLDLLCGLIDDAPTVIEADREAEDESD